MMSLLFSSWRRCIRFFLYILYSYCYGFLFPCLGNKFFHSQMLSERFKQEKHKLEANLGFSEHLSSEANSAACCIFCPEILCRKSRFDSWQDTLPLIDRTSLFLDIMLLQKLSSFLLLDPKRLQLVWSIKLQHSWYDVGTWQQNVIELYPMKEVHLHITKFSR